MVNRDKFLAEIRQALDVNPVEPPDDSWFSIKELIDGQGLSEKVTRDRLNQQVKAGKMERRRFGASYYYKVVK